MTLEELQVLITAKTAGLQSELKNVTKQLSGLQAHTQKATQGMQRSINNTSKSIANSMRTVKRTLAALGITKAIKDSFNLARTYESSLQQINRLLGQNSVAFQHWVDKNALTFGMAKADAIKYGSVFGNLLSGFITDTGTMTRYTEELLKASSIIASSTGRTMQDVMERIRSGLLGNTEAIEDLGVNVNVALLQTTDAFKQLANGKTWDKLSFQTQQQIRLMGILEQTSKKFGDSVQQNTNYRLMILTAQLKNVALNIGNAFMPIVNAVLPILSAFAAALERVTNTLAIFMNTLFGTNMQQVATNTQNISNGMDGVSGGLNNVADGYKDVGKEAEKAGKKAKGALASFDEVNQLNFGAAGGGDESSINIPSGGASSTSPKLENGISPKMSDAVSKFKESLEPTIDALKRLDEAMQPFKTFVWKGLQDFYELCLKPIGKWVMGEGLPRFIDAITKGLQSINWDRINSSLAKLWKALAPFTINVGEGLLWFWEKVLVPLSSWTISEILPRFLDSLATSIRILSSIIKGSLDIIKQLFSEFLNPIAKFTAPKVIDFLDNFNKKYDELAKLIENSSIWKDLKTILSDIYDILKPILEILIDITTWFANFKVNSFFEHTKLQLKDLEDKIGLVAAMLRGDFSDAWEHFKDLMIDNKIDRATAQIRVLGDTFGITDEKIKECVESWKKKILELVNDWKEKIEDWWINGVEPWFTKEKWDELLFNIGASFAEAVAKLIEIWTVEIPKWFEESVKPWFTVERWVEVFNSIKTSLSNTWNDTVTWWNSAISSWWEDKVKPWFTLERWRKLGETIKDGLVGGFRGAVNGIIGLLNNILGGFESMVNGVIEGINKMVEGYNSVAAVSPVPLPTASSLSRFSIPSIPMLARGGIVDSPTIAMIGEAGKEAVVPLENTSFVDKLASAVGNAVLAAMQFGNTSSSNESQEIVLEIDGKEVARVLANPLKKEYQRLGVVLK